MSDINKKKSFTVFITTPKVFFNPKDINLIKEAEKEIILLMEDHEKTKNKKNINKNKKNINKYKNKFLLF